MGAQDPAASPPPDLVDRDFTASRPNELWVVDFAYASIWSGMAFTAFVTDVFSRRIAGRRTAASMQTELLLDALEMALWTRSQAAKLVQGMVHHSDRTAPSRNSADCSPQRRRASRTRPVGHR